MFNRCTLMKEEMTGRRNEYGVEGGWGRWVIDHPLSEAWKMLVLDWESYELVTEVTMSFTG